MNNKIYFSLPTTKELFYKHYIQIINGIGGLSKKEISVLSDLMDYVNDFGENIEESTTYQKETATVNRLKNKGLLKSNGEHFKIIEQIYVPKQEGCDVIFRLRSV